VHGFAQANFEPFDRLLAAALRVHSRARRFCRFANATTPVAERIRFRPRAMAAQLYACTANTGSAKYRALKALDGLNGRVQSRPFVANGEFDFE
jgi:hypothetical protein